MKQTGKNMSAPTIVCPVTNAPAAIRYVGVEKSFGSESVLRGLDLIIPRGLITVIIGRSGTGKTVTLKHVMGLMRPDSGKIWVGEDELSGMGDRALRRVRSRFGMVFQHAALFDSMSVYDNVAFPLREHSKLSEKEIHSKVSALLDAVELQGSEDKLPGALSGGMRKRVGLARALIRDPEFLLYDEPTTGLDPILCAAMDDLIVRTQHGRPGITSIVISHDVHGILGIADKVVMLVDGLVAMEGTPESFRASQNPIVQRFLKGVFRQEN